MRISVCVVFVIYSISSGKEIHLPFCMIFFARCVVMRVLPFLHSFARSLARPGPPRHASVLRRRARSAAFARGRLQSANRSVHTLVRLGIRIRIIDSILSIVLSILVRQCFRSRSSVKCNCICVVVVVFIVADVASARCGHQSVRRAFRGPVGGGAGGLGRRRAGIKSMINPNRLYCMVCLVCDMCSWFK